MPRLLLATNNAGKMAELRPLLHGCGWDLVTPADIGLDFGVEETGKTYEENARTKAEAAARASGLVALADDSGLEVEALGAEPGVRSARFLGEDATYEQRFAEIQQRLLGTANRAARFVSVIAIYDPANHQVWTFEGEVRGLIANKPQGSGGFGYDPIFWLPQHSATMAEIPEDHKSIISHRARAVASARQQLKELLHDHQGNCRSYYVIPGEDR